MEYWSQKESHKIEHSEKWKETLMAHSHTYLHQNIDMIRTTKQKNRNQITSNREMLHTQILNI